MKERKVMDSTPITIDGSTGEGGGQIIRTSVSLAALTGRPLELTHIRARRSKPGLQAQHLTAVRAAAALCDAALDGDELGSPGIRFRPGNRVTHDSFRFDIADARNGASAGATGLVAQTVLTPMAQLSAERITVEILGGTHVPMAPTTDYIEAVYAPALCAMGLECSLSTARAGFYPKGGGCIHLTKVGGSLQTPIDWTVRGNLLSLRAFIVTSDLPEHVTARAQETLLKDLKGYGVPIIWELRALPGNGPGAAVVLTAECEHGRGGWTGLGERGKPMERVATEALRGFQRWYATRATVDEHLADQLVLPCAFIPSVSRWTTPEITDHLRTVLWVTQQFLPIQYSLESQTDGSGKVTMQGAKLP